MITYKHYIHFLKLSKTVVKNYFRIAGFDCLLNIGKTINYDTDGLLEASFWIHLNKTLLNY